MKTKTFLFLVLFLFSYINDSVKGQTVFYYADNGTKYFLNKLDSLVCIKFKERIPISSKIKLLEYYFSSNKLISLKLDSTKQLELFIIKDPSKIQELNLMDDIEYANFAFQYSDGVIQGLTNQIFVKFKEPYSITVLDSLSDVLSYRNVVRSNFDNNVLLVTLDKKSIPNALNICNILYEKGIVEYAEPNFKRYLKPYTSDEFFNLQWGLNNTGQYGGTPYADIRALDAWNITKGSSCIKVAVLDEGVDLTHPDLQANLLAGYDETGLGSGGAPQGNDAHGTNVAGIIGAIENTIGIVGVAPKCKIIPIRIAYEDANHNWVTDDNKIANGFYDAWHNAQADVINNSWGGSSPSTTITNAINMAVDSGRLHKGCPVFFASGNNNYSVSYPATLPKVIAVGAISMCDQRKRSSSLQSECAFGVHADPEGVSCDGEKLWGSNFGSELDIVAPGVKIYSTDIQGVNGYNHSSGTAGNYYDSFNGTSSACPHAVGVMALILSVNPSLTQTQARQKIEANTEKMPLYTFSTVSGHPNGTWNNQVGYGRVSAYKTLVASMAETISGNQLICSSGTFTLSSVPAGGTIVWQCSSNLTLGTHNGNSAQFNAIAGTNGSGWITVTITTSCGSYTLPKYNVWIGPPILQVTGPSEGCVNNTFYFATSSSYYANASNYTWDLVPLNGNYLSPYGYQNSQCAITFYNPYSASGYNVKARAQNTCGTGAYAQTNIWIHTCLSFSLYPNPASETVTVTKKVSGSTDNSLLSEDATTIYTIHIVDMSGSLFYTATKSGDSFNFPIYNLKDGIYVVQISSGKDSWNLQLVVKH